MAQCARNAITDRLLLRLRFDGKWESDNLLVYQICLALYNIYDLIMKRDFVDPKPTRLIVQMRPLVDTMVHRDKCPLPIQMPAPPGGRWVYPAVHGRSPVYLRQYRDLGMEWFIQNTHVPPRLPYLNLLGVPMGPQCFMKLCDWYRQYQDQGVKLEGLAVRTRFVYRVLCKARTSPFGPKHPTPRNTSRYTSGTFSESMGSTFR